MFGLQVPRDRVRADRLLDRLTLQPPGVGQHAAGEGRPGRHGHPPPRRQEHGHIQEVRRTQGECLQDRLKYWALGCVIPYPDLPWPRGEIHKSLDRLTSKAVFFALTFSNIELIAYFDQGYSTGPYEAIAQQSDIFLISKMAKEWIDMMTLY